MRAFRIAYDGRPFHGFQRQPDVPTVEDAVFDALRDLSILAPDADRPAGYAAAGRTDAGVSAVAQTIAFDAPAWCTPRALNAELPASVRAWASADAPADFHATHDAASRAYVYHLHAPDADADRAGEALAALVGTHDFHDLTADGEDTVRTVLDADLERDDDYLVLRIRAEGFRRHMVRRIATLVRAVGTGDAPRSKVDRALAPDPLPGPAGIPPAPAEGLVFVDAAYPDLDFERDEAAVESALGVFSERRVTARTAARVAEEVASGVRGGRDERGDDGDDDQSGR